MSESELQHDQELPPMSAVSRYYYDLLYCKDNLSTITMATHQLVEHLPFTSDLKIDDVFDADFIGHELDSEPRIAKEMLAMMPFMYIGPLLEKSNCSSEHVKGWFTDATKGVIMLTKDDHDVACLESDEGSLHHISCDNSAYCPHRFLERYLTDDVCLPDFTSRRYENDPLQAMTMAKIKMQVAKECQIVLAVYGETALVAYSDKCHEYLDQLMGRREISVDDISS